ncbi:unnamed protein product [Rotaria sp. Silwood1]|nr:unnamed protein product [Rotaria sp. Silwood1]
MNEEKEDPILSVPNLVKEESTSSIPMDTHDNEIISNNIDSTSDEKEKTRLNYDQRRINLLNNPMYGVILCFLDKFRSYIDLQDYPLHLLEENLLSDEENISRRLIDFHITLLKRIALGKGAQRDKFVPIITKFAYRFDYDDGEYLKSNGYSQAEIDLKLRILKNLLETQFDHNQGFKTALLEKQSFEVRSQPFGRDRSGASYWLFMDSECFIRLFREETDDERTWTNIAKDKDELENIIKILITDYIVRKKFPEWKFIHEPLNSLELSHKFEECYISKSINIKKEEEIKPISPSLSPAAPIKNECKLIINSKKILSPPMIKDEIQSDEESLNSADKNGQRSRMISSEDTNLNELPQEINNNQEDKELKRSSKKSRGRRKSTNWNKKKRRTMSNTSKKDEHEHEILTPKISTKGRKRKQLTDNEDDIQDNIKKNDETSQDKDINQIPLDDESNNNEDLPIALRRSRRIRKVPTNELPSVTSSPTKSVSQTPTKKKLTNGKCKTSSQTNIKTSSQSSKTNGRRKRRRGRNGKTSKNGCSSSSDDEHQPSEEEDEDDYDSNDYLPDKKQIDELNDEDLLEEEENDDEFVPRRSAKTVAKRRGQMNGNNIDDIPTSSSSCCVCSKTDRPESLLLCDDCDDAYHLECLKPILLSVPDGDWYCPLCEHKHLCDNLIEKLIQLIKEHDELEIKRNQCMSKRSNRLANVMLNLDRMVKRSTKKRRTNGIVYSDEENEDEEEQEQEEENNDDDEDDDSVYGFKDDGSAEGEEKHNRRDSEQNESTEKLGVRSCRRKPQNYRFDEYDKKMKEAMIEAGVNGDDIDKDSDVSSVESKKKSPKKRAGYEKDEDFNTSDPKNDDEFAPEPNRSGESGSEEEDYDDVDDDDEESSDDGGWKSKRRSSPKKKSKSKSNRSKGRKSKNKSDDDDDDDSLSETELRNIQTMDTTKSDTMNETDLNEIGNDDRRRSTRTTTQKNYAKQQEGGSDDDNDDEEEDLLEDGRPPPRRMRYKKRRGSDESFIDDDDDYEKLARKRKIVKYGKSISRSSITDHIKKLVDEDEQPNEEKSAESLSQDQIQEEIDDVSKQQNKIPPKEYDEPQPSDEDDDFPDEQEIFKANGLLKLQNNLGGPKPAGFRPPFMAPTHLYQHAIVDPTARFAMIRPPVRPAMNNGYPSNGPNNTNPGENQQPSDSNQVNGHNSPSS